MRTITAILAILMLTVPCMAKTNLFGDGREFIFAANQQTAILRGGFEPIEPNENSGGLQWGIAGQLFMDPVTEENHFRIDDSSWGLYLRYPFIEFESIPQIPFTGNLFADASILLDWDDFLAQRPLERDPIATLGLGSVLRLNDNLGAFGLVQYLSRSAILEEDDNIEFMAGVIAQW